MSEPGSEIEIQFTIKSFYNTCTCNIHYYYRLFFDSLSLILQIEDVSLFVDTVNGALKTQDETTRVQEVMKKIVGYAPVEIPGEFKEVRTHCIINNW